MNLISKLIGNKKLSAYYKKLSKSLIRQGYNKNILRAYFLFGIPYNATIAAEIKSAIINNKLNDLKAVKPSYDVSLDNIELYLIEETNNQFSIVLLLDRYELYTTEDILDVIPVDSSNFEKEIIFS
jgi:hypothetical protein